MVEAATVRFMQGSEAVAEGAMAAGLRFYAGYPITPSTEIAEILSRRLPRVGGVFIQMEDEIGSLAAVIGASIAGLKAATATSGPGFSLMQENLGFAVAAEIPCVLVNVQRAGPSTGQPTAPAQGDVMQARWGTHGDHPIVVLTASTVRECFDQTVRSFNLSERYRTPVILLLDEVVAHMRERTVIPAPEDIYVLERPQPAVPPEWYFPYEETDADVPPLASFGEGYRYHVTGLFHDRAGYPTLRQDEINPWFERLFRKIELNVDEIVQTQGEMLEDARTVIVAYGSTARAARQAMKEARAKGRRVGLLKLLTLWPFPEEQIERATRTARRFLVPEMNRGQVRLEVERVVKGRADVVGVHRYDGTVITPTQILQALEAH
ncbi:MAG: 2-oxoacid:acceptor oxidoreductase subunit alpha [Dehalococcoidales bacterium]|nr:2-oxoacid:acceptor oxidoreductase subunit alpha [Dehalococcoidales bacterium]